jgi:hypothetical protein
LASCITPDDRSSPEERATVIASARHAFAALPGASVALTAGEPEFVRAIEPASGAGYWLVPAHSGGAITAVARILRDGRVATVGSLSKPARDCAEAVTGLAASQVAALTGDLAREHDGQVEGTPILVHNGPVGREAWMLTLRRDTGRSVLVFATAGGSYVRS